MSYSTLFVVKANGEVGSLTEFKNSYGSAAIVWMKMVDRYRREILTDRPGKIYLGTDEWRTLFLKHEHLPLEWYEWNVFQWTHDYAITKFEDLPLLAKSLRAFHDAYKLHGTVSHLPAVADELDLLFNADPTAEPRHIGICYQHTSVSDDIWSVRSEDGEESYAYNVNTGTQHFFTELRVDGPVICSLEGKLVRMTEDYKKRCRAEVPQIRPDEAPDTPTHVEEFGDCVGIVTGWVKYFNKLVRGDGDGEIPVQIGPEVDVRWQPSNLRYGYSPQNLEIVEEDSE